MGAARSSLAAQTSRSRSPRKTVSKAARLKRNGSTLGRATEPLTKTTPRPRVATLRAAEKPRRPASTRTEGPRTPPVLDDAEFAIGGPGDHPTVYQLLSTVFPSADRDSFHNSLEDPFYEPCDRLLVKRGHHVLGHAHVTSRSMHLGEGTVPVAGLHHLAVLHEFRQRGYASELLRRAERKMLDDRAVAGFLTTSSPHFFRRSSWVVCGRHSHARARTRDVLAELSARGAPAAASRLSIRPWRHVELPALMRLYGQAVPRAHGMIERSEAYWRWLVGRCDFDQLYVALDGPDRLDFEAFNSPIVGYAFTKDDRILEVVAAEGYDYVAERLLARACGDWMERDAHTVALHAPPRSALFDVFMAAGGAVHHHEVDQGQVHMVKLFDPWAVLRGLGPELHRRAVRAELPRACELGVQVDRDRFRLVVTRQSVRVARDRLGRSYIQLNRAEFTRLLLGHYSAEEALAHDRIVASTRLAAEIAKGLFPEVPLWRAPLDFPSS